MHFPEFRSLRAPDPQVNDAQVITPSNVMTQALNAAVAAPSGQCIGAHMSPLTFNLKQTPSHLLPVRMTDVGSVKVNAVSGRDLHAFLEVGTAFNDWITRRIADFGFIEGLDFCSFLGKSSGGRPSKEYAISIGMAKELSMVERNDRGKEARLYFIECERRAQNLVSHFEIPKTYSAALRLAADLSEETVGQRATIATLEPRARAFDRIATASGSLCVTDAAKSLQVRPSALFMWLHENEWIYKRAGKMGWLAYQHRIQQGVLCHKVTTISRSDGTQKIVERLLVTPKGLTVLAKEFGKAVA